jgi:hypothetical protein
MNKIIFRILFFCIWQAILSPLSAQPPQKIVITGSVLQDRNDQPVEFAQVIFQLDSLRLAPLQTDQFGFFIFQCSDVDTGKNLKYFVRQPGFADEKGSLRIRSVNEPVLVRLPETKGPSEPILVSGAVNSSETKQPLPGVLVQLRIGDIILPAVTTDTDGHFTFMLVSDDLGKVATYRVYQTGFSPRYGYLSIQNQNSPLEINLAPHSLSVAGYVKNRETGAPLDRVQIQLWLNPPDTTLKYTNRWGFFSHTFQHCAREDTVFLFAQKDHFQSAAHKIYPDTNEELRLELKLVPRETDPIYKNKYFIMGGAGVAALVTSILIYQNVGESDENLSELPLPPIPPEK